VPSSAEDRHAPSSNPARRNAEIRQNLFMIRSPFRYFPLPN
jgi:hypothetical protein